MTTTPEEEANRNDPDRLDRRNKGDVDFMTPEERRDRHTREASRRGIMTSEQRREMHAAQARSWVRGEMGMGSDADEAAYARAIEDGDEETLARLRVESEERIKRFEEGLGK